MVVAGTGTGVGKTWVAVRLVGALRARGAAVAARKPAQSFDPGEPPALTDAALLGAASGEDPSSVCPPGRWYEVAMAPPMAADVLGRPPVTLGDLVAELRWPDPWPAGTPTVGVVEAAGGVRSPLADDGDTVDLVGALRPDTVVLVADAGLGTINAVRLCVDTLPTTPVVVLNRFVVSDDLHRRNRGWLAGLGLDVVTADDELAVRVLG